MKHNQKNAQHWQGIIQDQKNSGLSIRSWCNKNGINQGSFFYWKKRLVAESEQEVCFAEISLSDDSGNSAPGAVPFDAPVHIQYRDFEILVGESATCMQIVSVLEALKQSC